MGKPWLIPTQNFTIFVKVLERSFVLTNEKTPLSGGVRVIFKIFLCNHHTNLRPASCGINKEDVNYLATISFHTIALFIALESATCQEGKLTVEWKICVYLQMRRLKKSVRKYSYRVG